MSTPKFNIEEHTEVLPPPTTSPVPQKSTEEEQKQKIDDLKRRLQGKSLFVATPMFGGVCSGLFARSINELLVIATQLGLEVRTSNIFNEYLINRARNYLLQAFLDSTCTHIIWIDADISFNAYDVLTLLAYCETSDPSSNKVMDIVGGLYPKKILAADKMVAAAKAGLCDENPEDIFKYSADLVVNPISNGRLELNKPIQVSEIGTGFMLMSRDGINKIRRKNPKLQYTPDHIRTKGFDGSRKIYNLFEILIDPESNRLLSEDYGFLRLAKQIDLNIFIFPWINLVHVGNYMYAGNLLDLGVLYHAISEDYDVSLSGPLAKKKKIS